VGQLAAFQLKMLEEMLVPGSTDVTSKADILTSSPEKVNRAFSALRGKTRKKPPPIALGIGEHPAQT
jgi:hypothetical protein